MPKKMPTRGELHDQKAASGDNPITNFKKKLNKYLEEEISTPMYKRGFENLGPGIATGISEAADMLLPDDEADMVMGMIPGGRPGSRAYALAKMGKRRPPKPGKPQNYKDTEKKIFDEGREKVGEDKSDLVKYKGIRDHEIELGSRNKDLIEKNNKMLAEKRKKGLEVRSKEWRDKKLEQESIDRLRKIMFKDGDK